MNIIINKIKEIPGIEISSYPLNEALIQCRMKLTYSDAIEMCKKTKSGLVKNTKLRNMLYDQLVSNLNNSINEMRKNRNVPTP